MTERKVLNKYFPPDYDPSKIPRLPRGKKNRVFNLRTMAPFNMRCLTCKTYIYKARKFNSRMEPVDSEDYLGLRIYRFYIRCPACCSEISWKTDIANNDYVIESGALRTFEATRTAYKMAIEKEAQEAEDEKNNPMKLLENRTKQSKREMDELENLEDLKDSSMKHASLDIADRALSSIYNKDEEKKRKEEEEFQAELSELLKEQAQKREAEESSASIKIPTFKKESMPANHKKPKNSFSDLKSFIRLKKRPSASQDQAPSAEKVSKTEVEKDTSETQNGEHERTQPVIVKPTAEESNTAVNDGTGLGCLVGYSDSDENSD